MNKLQKGYDNSFFFQKKRMQQLKVTKNVIFHEQSYGCWLSKNIQDYTLYACCWVLFRNSAI